MGATKLLKLKNIVAFGTRAKSTIGFQEVRIPVPWGHIAGKWWGPQDKRPVLTLHGWQDNCGSFDLLIPTLPKHLGYLAIDFSGHGHSSKLPPGTFYHAIDVPIFIRRLQNYFGWKKLSLMGHSLGGTSAYTYGFMYPDNIDFALCIDGFQPLMNSKKVESATRTIDQFLKYELQSISAEEGRCYTIEEMAERLHIGSRKSIDLDKCRYLLERNISPSKEYPGKFFLHRDPRLKCANLLTLSMEYLVEAANRVKFPLFTSMAEDSPFFSDQELLNKYEGTIANLRRHGERFELHRVPGTHHSHLNHPEVFTDLITKFILKYDTEDRSTDRIVEEIFI